ncbi:hypothetical protein IscW_ISCW006793 [Ixodes scapularis]|uniref:Uncharacterized protein n=1 Tax=Ixodes scapularis TaxID=6945 RepID=B7PP49_IXOSC|nr:hypothetical protein IscW_ISCW006793 [Ixodes scapularis]|eukprot:XP_002435541.1 hypothetical protein IscW_ISCW006793 [Ixodes scapularis]
MALRSAGIVGPVRPRPVDLLDVRIIVFGIALTNPVRQALSTVVKFKKSMFHFLVSYDKGIFGFGRRRFWRLTLNEESLHLRVAVNASNRIRGYAGLQEDTKGVPVLRWLIANDGETAKQLLFNILADSHAFREHGVWLALYVRSHIASELLKHVDTSRLQPWMQVFNRKEPFLHYRNIVVFTYI